MDSTISPLPSPAAGEDYPGYPLVANAYAALPWFFGALPLLIALAWLVSRRPPLIDPSLITQATKENIHATQ